MFIIICFLNPGLAYYSPIIFLAFFCFLFNKIVTKAKAEAMKYNRGVLLKKPKFSVYTSKRIYFASLLLIHCAQYCGTISIFVLASYTGFKPLITHLATSTWLKSGTSLLPFWDEKHNGTRGCAEWHQPAHTSGTQGLKCVLFLEYSGGFWEEFWSLLDISICPHKSWQNIFLAISLSGSL